MNLTSRDELVKRQWFIKSTQYKKHENDHWRLLKSGKLQPIFKYSKSSKKHKTHWTH